MAEINVNVILHIVLMVKSLYTKIANYAWLSLVQKKEVKAVRSILSCLHLLIQT